MTTENLGYGTGRRKTSVARVYLRAGNGNITINNKKAEERLQLPEQIRRSGQRLRRRNQRSSRSDSSRIVPGIGGCG